MSVFVAFSQLLVFQNKIVVVCLFKLTIQSAEHGEGLQILHYEVGQKYEPHFDYFLDNFNVKHGGQRTATMLMYL